MVVYDGKLRRCVISPSLIMQALIKVVYNGDVVYMSLWLYLNLDQIEWIHFNADGVGGDLEELMI